MNEIEKLVETYLRTNMTAETFMRKARIARSVADTPRSANAIVSHSGKSQTTLEKWERERENTIVPTASDMEITSTGVMGVANETISRCELNNEVPGKSL